MKSFMKLCEENENNIELFNIIVTVKYGNPISIQERIMKNVTVDGSSYVGKIQSGKRFVDARLSTNRIDNGEFSLYQGVLQGDIWCFKENKDDAKKKLLAKTKEMIEAIIETWRKSLNELNV